MFVLRLKKKRFIIALTAVLAVITAFLVIINADFTSVEDNVEKNSKIYSLKADSADDRLGFFKQLELKAGQETADEVVIPQNFNRVYDEYNEIQKSSGFDLLNYAGKTAKRYTYSIDNGKKAVILVYKNRIIGGHIASGIYGEEYLPLI